MYSVILHFVWGKKSILSFMWGIIGIPFKKMNEISLVPHRQKYIHYFGYIVDSHSLYWPLGSGNFVRGGGPIWP